MISFKLIRNKVFTRARNFLRAYSNRVEFFIGILVGLLGNILTNNVNSGSIDFHFLVNYYQPMFWITWLLLFIIIALTFVLWCLNFVLKNDFSLNAQIANLYDNYIDSSIKPFCKGRIAWGKSITLANCVDLNDGWKVEDIVFKYSSSEYKFGKALEAQYELFRKIHFPSECQDDPRIMLVKIPQTGTHQQKLILELRKTTYSRVLFSNEVFMSNKDYYIPHFLSSAELYELPQTVYLAIFVHTSDRKVLREQISHMSKFDPDKWALSLGEQLDVDDINNNGTNSDVIRDWLKHALRDELGLEPNIDYYFDKFRCSAIHLDSHNGNIGLSIQIDLDITSTELDAALKLPRKDNEFFNWNYITVDELAKELVNPSPGYVYPDNMGLRMLYGGYSLQSIGEFHESLLKYKG